MKVAYNGIIYEVYWSYGRANPLDKRGMKCFFTEFTNCHIESLKAGVSIITMAIKSQNDQFNKEIGRKISLTRALKQLFPEDKEARRVFWSYYFYTRNYATPPRVDLKIINKKWANQ